MRKVLAVTAMMFCCAPGWSADWLTDGGDAQRTGWQKNEKILTKWNGLCN